MKKLWAGGPYRNDNPKGKEVLAKTRELVFANRLSEAQKLIDENFSQDSMVCVFSLWAVC